MKNTKDKSKLVRIWTLKYEPFMFGGTLYRPIFTMALPMQTIKVSGYSLHIFKNPFAAKYHVAEASSGALVGHGKSERNHHFIGSHQSLAEAISKVTGDISTGSKKLMKKQVEDAIIEGQTATEIDNKLFFKFLSH